MKQFLVLILMLYIKQNPMADEVSKSSISQFQNICKENNYYKIKNSTSIDIENENFLSIYSIDRNLTGLSDLECYCNCSQGATFNETNCYAFDYNYETKECVILTMIYCDEKNPIINEIELKEFFILNSNHSFGYWFDPLAVSIDPENKTMCKPAWNFAIKLTTGLNISLINFNHYFYGFATLIVSSFYDCYCLCYDSSIPCYVWDYNIDDNKCNIYFSIHLYAGPYFNQIKAKEYLIPLNNHVSGYYYNPKIKCNASYSFMLLNSSGVNPDSADLNKYYSISLSVTFSSFNHCYCFCAVEDTYLCVIFDYDYITGLCVIYTALKDYGPYFNQVKSQEFLIEVSNHISGYYYNPSLITINSKNEIECLVTNVYTIINSTGVNFYSPQFNKSFIELAIVNFKSSYECYCMCVQAYMHSFLYDYDMKTGLCVIYTALNDYGLYFNQIKSQEFLIEVSNHVSGYWFDSSLTTMNSKNQTECVVNKSYKILNSTGVKLNSTVFNQYFSIFTTLNFPTSDNCYCFCAGATSKGIYIYDYNIATKDCVLYSAISKNFSFDQLNFFQSLSGHVTGYLFVETILNTTITEKRVINSNELAAILSSISVFLVLIILIIILYRRKKKLPIIPKEILKCFQDEKLKSHLIYGINNEIVDQDQFHTDNHLLKFDVFLSYSEKDKAYAKKIFNELSKPFAFKVWFDENEIKSGDNIADKIHFGIINSEFMICIASKHYVEDEKCVKECQLGILFKKKQFLVLFEKLNLDDSSIGFYVIGTQRCNLYKANDSINFETSDEFKNLIKELKPLSYTTNVEPCTPKMFSCEPIFDVFLSYCHKEKTKAEEIYEFLTKILKLKVWMDKFEIKLGNDFAVDILNGVRCSRLLICLISENYIKSENCVNELKLGKYYKKKILLVILEKIRLSRSEISSNVKNLERITLFRHLDNEKLKRVIRKFFQI